MEYSIEINRQFSDGRVERNLQTWPQVVSVLRSGLDADVTSLKITKWSSDGRKLASKCVTMKSIVKVATSLTDKCLTSK